MGCSKAKASTLRTTSEEPLRARLSGTSDITRACEFNKDGVGDEFVDDKNDFNDDNSDLDNDNNGVKSR